MVAKAVKTKARAVRAPAAATASGRIAQPAADLSDLAEQRIIAALRYARRRTLGLIAHLDEDRLLHPVAPIMSPLVWDLAHIAAYEDLWIAHRHAGLPLLRPALAATYDAFETPRTVRGDIELLNVDQTLQYMRDVRARTLLAIGQTGVGDGSTHEMVIRHELQHTETMLQAMAIGDMLPQEIEARLAESPDDRRLKAPRALASSRDRRDGDGPLIGATSRDRRDEDGPRIATDGEWIEVPAGAFAIGADGASFAYDNERPRHEVELSAFKIAKRPLTNAQWRQFCERGGYREQQWWSAEGWAWRQHAEPLIHPRAGDGREHDPLCHVCFYEAEAIAKANDARLPSEAEWEVAASLPHAPLAVTRAVWEWTSSEFDGYPGFKAHPYKEYSEVFFDKGYFVLRGGSWATDPRVATRTFRNWDLPIRRQIFAGLRLAKDA